MAVVRKPIVRLMAVVQKLQIAATQLLHCFYIFPRVLRRYYNYETLTFLLTTVTDNVNTLVTITIYTV